MKNEIAACWYVLGIYRATAKARRTDELMEVVNWSRQGVTGGFYNPIHAVRVVEYARSRGFPTNEGYAPLE